MFVEYNANPQELNVGDCVIRAISTAEEESWAKIYLDLCIYGLMQSDLPMSNEVWGRFLVDKGYEYFPLPNRCPYCYTVDEFCKDYPEGIYILGTGSHAICVKDGNFFDSWNSGRCMPLYAFKKMED